MAAAVPVPEVAPGVPERRRFVVLGDFAQGRTTLVETLAGDGFTLVDSAYPGGLGSAGGAAGMAAAATAGGALFVTSAGEELTDIEYAYLRRLRTVCGSVTGVLTKIDFYPGWRAVLTADRHRFNRLDVPLFAISAILWRYAQEAGDPALADESGYPALAGHLAAQAALPIPQPIRSTDIDHDVDLRARIGAVRAAAEEAIAAGDPAHTWDQLGTRLRAGLAWALVDDHLARYGAGPPDGGWEPFALPDLDLDGPPDGTDVESRRDWAVAAVGRLCVRLEMAPARGRRP